MKSKLLIALTCLAFVGCKSPDDAAFNKAFEATLNDLGNARAELSSAREALRTNPTPATVERYNRATFNAINLKDAEEGIRIARKNWKP